MIEELKHPCPDWLYRVKKEDDGLYLVAVYPASKAIPTSKHRIDVLPEWMKERMRLLDLAGTGHRVNGVGVRYGEEFYWIGDHEWIQ